MAESKNPPFNLQGLPHVRISLLDNQGRLPTRSGLNWGQRPEYNRNTNEAYIRVPSDVNYLDFFPDVGIHFTIRTDDGEALRCTRAQDNSKAIETYNDNSLMGRYFRKRLGLADGVLIRKEDLLRYGRTHIDFYKVDNVTFYMDFSK
jgi:hypothetical protein